jgi:hypothetical protein
VFKTGELHGTSFLFGELPAGRVLYATVWTKAGGVWEARQSSFTTQLAPAVLAAPAAGAEGVAAPQDELHWTSAPYAQAYRLCVGTAPGARDVIDTGETPSTSYLARNLPALRRLSASLYTRISGKWYATNGTFTTGPQLAVLSAPSPGSGEVGSPRSTFRWTGVPNAQAYRLRVGTGAGSGDLADSGAIDATEYRVDGLPGSTRLYATILTEIAGRWRQVPESFTTGLRLSVLTEPGEGESGVAAPRFTFRWAGVPTAQGYYLYVGTTPGMKDVVNTGGIRETCFAAENLPGLRRLYVTLFTELRGVWYPTTGTFTTGPQLSAPEDRTSPPRHGLNRPPPGQTKGAAASV